MEEDEKNNRMFISFMLLEMTQTGYPKGDETIFVITSLRLF